MVTQKPIRCPLAPAVSTACIDTDYIELDKLLKRENLAASGGEARYLISQGWVLVNGIVETRKRKKLRPGDVVQLHEVAVRVEVAPSLASDNKNQQEDGG